MKPIRYAIFDVDGTLADSMHCWQMGVTEYLAERGHGSVMTPTLFAEIRSLSVIEGVMLLAHRYPDLLRDFTFDSYRAIIERHYLTDVSLRVGVREMLDTLRAAGVRMCVISASFEAALTKLFSRFGIADYFEFIFTGEHYPKGKKDREVFEAALARLSAKPEETMLFEDSYYSAKTAHGLGIRIAAIRDESEHEWEKLRAIADVVFDDGVFTHDKIHKIVN